ncbi:MAG: endonuclease III domain-containing protein [Chloroflexota bacterium]
MEAERGEGKTVKQPFDIDVVMARIREAVRPFPKAALFELAEAGFASPFEQLVACVISIRTRDEVTLPTARRLFAIARTPADFTRLSLGDLDSLIHASSFHEAKARQILAAADRVVDEFGGVLPCDGAILTTFLGVGPKCAHLVLGIACGQPAIAVDVHVFRVTNRWGYVHAATPEQTMAQLEERLPRRYWVEINQLLIPFGKHVCTARLPRCSTCPVLEMCQQVGVTAHR